MTVLSLLHALGRHGNNWRVHWYLGNIWRICKVCGTRRQLSSEDADRIPSDHIEGHPDDGLAEWRARMGIVVK